MSDLIFKTNGEEKFRIPFPTPGTKCPEMKLEIKMTETDISKVLIEGEYAIIMGVKYKRVEEPKTPVEEAYKEVFGKYPETGSDATKFDIQSWNIFRYGWNAAKEDGVVDEPDWYDEVEWDEKDNPKPMDEVVNRLIKQHQAQKLYNMARDELGYSFDCCDEFVDLVERWLPKEQSAAGSQNVDTELLVDGFNHCLEKIKGMLR
jgi:hypothetical protein